jgi:hypothetical protein
LEGHPLAYYVVAVAAYEPRLLDASEAAATQKRGRMASRSPDRRPRAVQRVFGVTNTDSALSFVDA